jgi:hypothetical protein
MKVKFRVAKPIKHIKTSGNWFIAWGSYTKAAYCVFPHCQEEFDTFGRRILSLFSTTAPTSHSAVINLNTSI